MDCGHGSSDTQQQPNRFPKQPTAQQHQVNDQKRLNRAPTPEKGKDVPAVSLARTKGSSGAPANSTKPGTRLSPHNSGNGKEMTPEKGKPSWKAKPPVAGSLKCGNKSSGRRKPSDASNASDSPLYLSKDTGCAPGKLSPSDSSSEISDCTSEENKLSPDALSSDIESRSLTGEADRDRGSETYGNGVSLRDGGGDQHVEKTVDKDIVLLGLETGERNLSPSDARSFASTDSRLNFSTSLVFTDLTEEIMNRMQDEFVREIEELRSENDYLKDELEEVRSEMQEMRDMYLEEDEYQVQVLRQQLDQANKTCRILQYRLRKAERRSLRVAQTGHVDGELIRALEQDLKVAKDVSIRLHGELESVERKRAQLEQENEELRERLQDLEVTSQVLQAEMNRSRENSLKRRGSRSSKPEKKLSPQEDSTDLKCQLHFAKEESALMCRKLAKMAKESEGMAQELARFRSLYGEVDSALTGEEVANSRHTREAEVRVHLKLVEEEANLLSRRIVELEVENRGLRAEMEESKGPELPGGVGPNSLGGAGGGDAGEGAGELRKQLQFVEEEAELLRRSLLELEEQNKALVRELDCCRVEQEAEADSSIFSEDSSSMVSEASQEEPTDGKARKLQRHNRALLSDLQLCHLEATVEPEDSAKGMLGHGRYQRPIGGENHPLEEAIDGCDSGDNDSHSYPDCGPQYLWLEDYKALLSIRAQACLISTTIQLLTASSSSSSTPAEQEGVDNSQALLPDLPSADALVSGLENLQMQLLSFVERVEALEGPEETYLQQTLCSPDSQSLELRSEESQSLQLLCLQLRSFLKHWHLGKRMVQEGREMNSVKDLCLLMEEEGLAVHQGDKMASSKEWSQTLNSKNSHDKDALILENHMQTSRLSSVLSDLKGALLELIVEMKEERQEYRELAQQFDSAKASWDKERIELQGQIAQPLHDKTSEKDSYTDITANKTDLQGTSDITFPSHRDWKYLTEETAPPEVRDLFKSWDCPIRTSSLPGLDLSHEGVPRSYTAPDRTGLRIYLSPPAARRMETRLDRTRKQFGHGCPPTEPEANRDVTSDGWPGRTPEHHRDQPESSSEAAALALGVLANLSDDMKEMTNCVRQAMRPASLERKCTDAASQTVGVACQTEGVTSAGTQTALSVSVGLQTEGPHGTAGGLHPKTLSPRASSLVSSRARLVSTSLERMPGRAERSGCSPRCSSPKLQRRVSTPSSIPLSISSSTLSSTCSSSTFSSTSSFTSSSSSRLEGSSSAPLWSLRQRGQNGSAWARSTTPRDRPALGGRSDGVTGAAERSGEGKATGKAIPEVGPAHKYGIVQEFFRNVCGRGHVPAVGGRGRAGRRNPGDTRKPERPAPRTAGLAGGDRVTKIVNKRFMRQTPREALNSTEKSVEDGACDCTSRSLTSCFARPSRSAMRHAPGQCRLRSREPCQTAEGKDEPARE
ncbi:protein SOGA1-like [Megalops cyprinoides]|uniref:protein SOGA1-like n=1 Tax=Megalops cyprinoides TaxID=118141 RepID=UPI0018646257|nr:protein SOGA1-like [Megalops cyprinoides]